MNFKFEVFDALGNNVTDDRDWIIRPDGILCYAVEDIGDPIKECEIGFTVLLTVNDKSFYIK